MQHTIVKYSRVLARYVTAIFSLASCASSTGTTPEIPTSSKFTVVGTWSEIGSGWKGRSAGDSTFKFAFTIDSNADGLSVNIKQDRYVLQQSQEVFVRTTQTAGTVVESPTNGQLTIAWDAYGNHSAMTLDAFHDTLIGGVSTGKVRQGYFLK